MKAFLTANKISKLEKVHRSTVVRWIKKGLFGKVKRTGKSGSYVISLSQYEQFRKDYR